MLALGSVFNAAASGELAESSVTLTPDWNARGKTIPDDFCGLSFEASSLLPDKSGKHFFDAGDEQLISVFKSLGVKSLRVGGNSADEPRVKIPAEPDIDCLFAFAKSAGVRVIYNLRLKRQTDPQGDVRLVTYIMGHYKPLLDSFTIGNEPDDYFHSYDTYRDQWQKFQSAILAAEPDAPLNGPSTATVKWCPKFCADIGPSGSLKLVTFHAYFGGDAQKVPDAAAARALILSTVMEGKYQWTFKSLAPAVQKQKLPFRLEETNSLYNGGAAGVSNTFASALWALDYMYWWANHGAVGLNFHTNHPWAPDETQIPGGYDILYFNPNGLQLHPIAYALKAFSLTANGRIVPIRVESPEKLNLTAYGVAASDSQSFVTIVNKESGSAGRTAEIKLDAGTGYVAGSQMTLSVPDNDISLLSGVTLGGGGIDGNGGWSGKWTSLAEPASPGQFTVQVPPATAIVIRLRRDAAR